LGSSLKRLLKGRRELPTLSQEANQPLSPVPVPQLATLPDGDLWDFLHYSDPISDPDMLSFQVAQLTLGMGELKRRIDELERGTK